MKQLTLLLILSFISISFPSWAEDNKSAVPSVLTLKECYKYALKQSEAIAVKEQVIKEAQGRFYQALSGILPDISFVLTEEWQDDGGSNARGRERKFTFSQPLFSGFSEFAAISASRAEKRQRVHEKKRAEELLFADVADAFYFFLSYQDEVKTLEGIKKALEDRLEELKKREALGRSRPSEIANAQARLSRVEADLEEVWGEWDIARQLLEFLTGVYVGQLQDEKIDHLFSHSLEEYLKNVEERSDVSAFFESYQAAQKEVAVSRAGFYPEVSLEGTSFPTKTGTSSSVDWDATLTVDVPIFKGAENIGAVKEAKALAEQEKLLYEQAKRKAVLDIQNAYTRLDRAVKKEDAFLKAYEAAKRNYELQVEDYQKNLVNNLEVLQSLEDLQEAERDFKEAENETKRLFWNLKVSTGEIHDAI